MASKRATKAIETKVQSGRTDAQRTRPARSSQHRRHPGRKASRPAAKVRVRVVRGDIARIGERGHRPGENIPVDAIAVGHYRDVLPVNAEQALDVAVSKAVNPKRKKALVVTQLAERRIIVGEKARPFFLPDPRRPGRTIAIVGMGYPKQFSMPELVALVQNLAWSLGLVGKKHLATVLIGAGDGNLRTEDAIEAWLRGLSASVDEIPKAGAGLKAVTFVELSPARLAAMQRALNDHAGKCDFPQLEIVERRPGPDGEAPAPKEDQPAYITVELSGRTFEVGAVSSHATAGYSKSGAQPALIFHLNDALVLASDEPAQLQKGEALRRTVFQDAFWQQLALHAPMVVICDPPVARVAWEMLVEPSVGASGVEGPPEVRFLGLGRGLTRQLKVEPTQPLPARDPEKILKVLLVADPAKDQPLEAARAEGEALKKLFDRHNGVARSKRHGERVQVKAMLGPEQATLVAVMAELQSESYDVLHYAGHCIYDLREPRASGLVFSNKERLTAGDIGQLGKMPSFVFANACYSGLVKNTGGRGTGHSAPTLAQAFLLGGAGNFVCAAWSVNTQAGLAFSQALYENLIGVQGPPQPMHVAMRLARLAARKGPEGVTTWGAYQHYGNPYFRLLAVRR